MEIHGAWRLHVIRDIVVSAVSGSWNAEAMVAYFAAFQAAAAPLGRFCSVIVYTDWGGFTADAAAIAIENRRRIAEQGCVCVAWIVDAPLMKKWAELFMRHREDIVPETRIFAVPAEACAWLAEKGFALDPAELAGPAG